tara:strand:+ start:351 stop:788 length:438 start_codon:yes stop_codon:yes gene_type:complete
VQLLSGIKYTKTHEWIIVTDEINWIATMGIAERVQLIHGDIVFIEMAVIGDEFEAEEIIGQINVVSGETIPIHIPVTGEVIEINELIEENVDVINQSPEGDGWVLKIAFESSVEFASLMDQDDYDMYEEDSDLDPEYLDDDEYDE